MDDPVSVFDFPDEFKCLYCPKILEYHEAPNMLCYECEMRFHPNDYNYGFNYFNYGYITQDDFTDDELELNPDLYFYDEAPSETDST
jgi:hypothetical protein